MAALPSLQPRAAQTPARPQSAWPGCSALSSGTWASPAQVGWSWDPSASPGCRVRGRGVLGAAATSPLAPSAHASPAGLRLWFVPAWPSLPVHQPHGGASPRLLAAPSPCSPSPGALGCTQRAEMLQTLPVTPHFALLCPAACAPAAQHSTPAPPRSGTLLPTYTPPSLPCPVPPCPPGEPQAGGTKRGALGTICGSPGGRRDMPSAQPPSGTMQALLYF